MKVILSLGAAVVVALAALVTPLLLPRGEGPPPLRAAERYLTHVETAVFNGPLDAVRATLQEPDTGVLAFVTPTDRIPALQGLTEISGQFPDEGAVRQVHLETGDHVTERVLVSTDTEFAYQIWAFTAGNARPIDHIRGAFEYHDLGDGRTEVRWTYAVAPRVFYARPFIQIFLDNDFGPFMQAGLSGAAEAFNASVAS